MDKYIITVHSQGLEWVRFEIFKCCDNLNRECGRVKNGGWRFDCDEKNLNLTHLSMRLAHPH